MFLMQILVDAAEDISESIRRRPLWLALAKEDIGDQHRRTALGPLWLLLNYLAFAGTFIAIFGHSDPYPAYPAYVAVGLLVWFYIMEVLTQSVSLFVREAGYIKGTTLPLSLYVMRLTAQSVIRMTYALAGCVAILVLAGTPVTTSWFSSLAGLALVVVATPAAITVFAILGTFFADIQFIMPHVMRLGMFLTPVFWVHTGGGGVRDIFYYWNPFTYFLEMVREPIITGTVPVQPFVVSAAMTLGVWALAIFLLGRFRKEIVFYV
jgi:lipopolysaccharide transport system permease protein